MVANKSLIICDQDHEYALRLAAYLGNRKELGMQIKVCADPEQITFLQEEMAADVVIADERLKFRGGELDGVGQVIWLTTSVQSKKEPKIYRYQPGVEIYSLLIQHLATTGVADSIGVRNKKKGKLIGVYSPIRRIGQTTLALNKGKELARGENVLYLNLETYAGIGGHFPEESRKNLSQLLYYVKQEIGNIGLLVTTLVQSIDQLDYIPPVVFPEDLMSVGKDEWIRMFREILEYSIYTVVILDLGDSVQGLFDILTECDEIYVPTVGEKIAVSKLYQFEEVLEKQGYGEIWERMIRCDIRRTTER